MVDTEIGGVRKVEGGTRRVYSVWMVRGGTESAVADLASGPDINPQTPAADLRPVHHLMGYDITFAGDARVKTATHATDPWLGRQPLGSRL